MARWVRPTPACWGCLVAVHHLTQWSPANRTAAIFFLVDRRGSVFALLRIRSSPGLPWFNIGWGSECCSGFGSVLAGDEALKDLVALGGLCALGLDVGVEEAGSSSDERWAGEEEAGRGGALSPHIAATPSPPSSSTTVPCSGVWKTERNGVAQKPTDRSKIRVGVTGIPEQTGTGSRVSSGKSRA